MIFIPVVGVVAVAVGAGVLAAGAVANAVVNAVAEAAQDTVHKFEGRVVGKDVVQANELGRSPRNVRGSSRTIRTIGLRKLQ